MLVGPPSWSGMTSMLKLVQIADHGVIVGICADDGRKFRSLYTKGNIMTEQEY
jgi:cysteine synthase B